MKQDQAKTKPATYNAATYLTSADIYGTTDRPNVIRGPLRATRLG